MLSSGKVHRLPVPGVTYRYVLRWHFIFLESEIYGWCNGKAGFNPKCAELNHGKMACAGTWKLLQAITSVWH